MDWIYDNRNWLFEGAGVALIGVLFTFVYKLFISPGKDNTSKQKNESQKIKNGDSNIQIQRTRGNVTINQSTSNQKKRPVWEIQFNYTGAGQSSRGYGSKNSEYVAVPDIVYVFDVHWEYDLVIWNNSGQTAYNVEMSFFNEDNLINIYPPINKLQPIPPNSKIHTRATLNLLLECKSHEASIITEETYPNEVKNMNIDLKYTDEDRVEFHTLFKFENDKQKNELL